MASKNILLQLVPYLREDALIELATRLARAHEAVAAAKNAVLAAAEAEGGDGVAAGRDPSHRGSRPRGRRRAAVVDLRLLMWH